MIGHFTTRLEVEAKKAGGTLSSAAIRAISERFLTEEQSRFGPVFQRSYQDCSHFRDSAQWEGARRRPFDRILIHRFAHLFPSQQGGNGEILSRRMIPGFGLALDKMIGPTLYQQCHQKSQAITDRHRDQNGDLDWEGVHSDPQSQALTNDVLTVIAHAFTDFDHRRQWFLQMVNNRLPPAEDCPLGTQWQLTEHGFSEIMRALFTDLRISMTKDREKLRHRYGNDICRSLEGFLRRL